MHIENPVSPRSPLAPQEQLAVALYLKSMNKAQAAREAGYASTAVFNKPAVQAAVAEGIAERAQRLRVGADWVLIQLKKCYDTSVGLCDMRAALRSLDLIGKHCDVQAWVPAVEDTSDEVKRDILLRGRKRALEAAQAREQAASVLVPLSAPESPAEVAEAPDFSQPAAVDNGEEESQQVESISPRAQELIEKLRGETQSS